MKNRQNKRLLLSMLPAVALVLVSIQAGADTIMEPDIFPVYNSIRPNISFWKKIYSEYPTTQGVVHEKSRHYLRGN